MSVADDSLDLLCEKLEAVQNTARDLATDESSGVRKIAQETYGRATEALRAVLRAKEIRLIPRPSRLGPPVGASVA